MTAPSMHDELARSSRALSFEIVFYNFVSLFTDNPALHSPSFKHSEVFASRIIVTNLWL